MKHTLMALTLLLSVSVAAVAAPMSGGGMSSSSSTSIHSSSSSSSSSVVSGPSPVYTMPPPIQASSKPSFGINTAPAPFAQANTTHGIYNPLLGPNPAQVQVSTPGYASGGYYGGYGYYGGGGVAPEIAPQGPPGYDEGSGPAGSAAAGLTPSETPDEESAPPVVLKQVQYIGRLLDFSAETVTLRTASQGDVTLFGRRSPTTFHRGDLIVAWALTNGYWTSLTRVPVPQPSQE